MIFSATPQQVNDSLSYRELVESIKILQNEDLPYEYQYPQCYTAPDFEGRVKRFRVWLKENNIYYYGKPHDSFFKLEAYDLAKAAGCDKLILEDLS